MYVSGDTLRLLRQIKGLKQDTVAKDLGITQPAYSKIEKCKNINKEKIGKILSVMGYSVEEFCELIDSLPGITKSVEVTKDLRAFPGK